MGWYFTHITAFIHSNSFTTWVLWLRLYFIGEEMEALWVGDFPGSHELGKNHQNLVWSKPVTIPAGPPCSAQCCWLVEQAVLGGGPILGIKGLLVASMVPPEASSSHQSWQPQTSPDGAQCPIGGAGAFAPIDALTFVCLPVLGSRPLTMLQSRWYHGVAPLTVPVLQCYDGLHTVAVQEPCW